MAFLVYNWPWSWRVRPLSKSRLKSISYLCLLFAFIHIFYHNSTPYHHTYDIFKPQNFYPQNDLNKQGMIINNQILFIYLINLVSWLFWKNLSIRDFEMSGEKGRGESRLEEKFVGICVKKNSICSWWFFFPNNGREGMRSDVHLLKN